MREGHVITMVTTDHRIDFAIKRFQAQDMSAKGWPRVYQELGWLWRRDRIAGGKNSTLSPARVFHIGVPTPPQLA